MAQVMEQWVEPEPELEVLEPATGLQARSRPRTTHDHHHTNTTTRTTTDDLTAPLDGATRSVYLDNDEGIDTYMSNIYASHAFLCLILLLLF